MAVDVGKLAKKFERYEAECRMETDIRARAGAYTGPAGAGVFDARAKVWALAAKFLREADARDKKRLKKRVTK